MIANVIYNKIATQFASKITTKKDLFLEKGVGNKNIVIKTIGTKNPDPSIDDMRFTKVYVLINGWKTGDAMNFAEDIVKFVKDLRGEYSVGTKSYLIKEISIAPFPFPTDTTRTDATQVISFGIGIYYIEI